jgi:hypothetical protein
LEGELGNGRRSVKEDRQVPAARRVGLSIAQPGNGLMPADSSP